MKTREEQRMMLAGMAMQGLCANANAQISATSYAECAVSFADALLAELDRTAPKPETPTPDADGWIPHRPGDAMPCDAGADVFVQLADGTIFDGPDKAGYWAPFGQSDCDQGDYWGGIGQIEENPIIAWKPA